MGRVIFYLPVSMSLQKGVSEVGPASRAARAAKKNENMQHSAFPRGPPPQYYPSSNQLIFPVRMGRVDPG